MNNQMTARQEEIIELARDNDHKLTEWEFDFMESLESQSYELTLRQMNVLDKIADKVGYRE